MTNENTTRPDTTRMSFAAETSKVLQLMIHSLYTNKDIFLRELISNASDACDKLRYQAQTDPQILGDAAGLGITIAIDKQARTLSIADTGIGMSREELILHLGTIAKSGTQELLSQLSGDAKGDVNLIGQFGVGFYSAFMVAESVEVDSLKAGSRQAHRWRSDGQGEFTVEALDGVHPRGTRITLHLKEGEDAYLDAFRLRHIVQTYSDHIAFPIRIDSGEGAPEVVNKASALWMRPKSELAEEDYTQFYRHVAHAPDKPWLTLHSKVEGKLTYTCLLFVPGIRPFDLFHPDRKSRVRLYVKRVFITDEGVSLVPSYLRFLRGVIDSDDLPLNISRETLQASAAIAAISDSVTKRVLSELKKKAEADAEGYATFWQHFGAVLKEGLCEATSPREAILEVCQFYSSTEGKLTSLDAYLARRKQGDQPIYVLTGDSLDALKQNPRLEGFAKRGLEVLLLADHVDDFWLSVVHDYKGTSFTPITRADLALEDTEKTNAEKEEKNDAQALEPLLARCKVVLGEHARDVRITSKLASAPSCLAVEEGMMDSRLERFLIEQKQLPGFSPKIMELNPEHPLIQALAAKADGPIDDAIWLLFDQARLAEGENVTDAMAFARRLNDSVLRAVAA